MAQLPVGKRHARARTLCGGAGPILAAYNFTGRGGGGDSRATFTAESGLYQFHDVYYHGGVRGVVAAYDNGTELTRDGFSDLTDEPISGEYIADGNFIKVRSTDEVVLTMDVQGDTIIKITLVMNVPL